MLFQPVKASLILPTSPLMTIQHTEVERLTPPAAAAVLGLAYPGTFNRIRRRLQRIYDRGTGTLLPFPNGLARRAERELAHEHILVVPEWGAVSWFGSDWTYSRQACESWGTPEPAPKIGVDPVPAP